MVNLADEKAFVTVTNSDIYREIKALRTDVQVTNGQVKTHRKLINVLFIMVALLVGGFINLTAFS